MQTLKSLAWILTLVVGAVFAVAGLYATVQAVSTRDRIVDDIEAEKIVTTEDSSIPNAPVRDVETAEAMEDIIALHAAENTGGKTYAELDREDPQRDLLLRATTLRTALNSFIMAYRVTELVFGIGIALIIGGLLTMVVGAPTVHSVTRE